jgi:hypothetical protein
MKNLFCRLTLMLFLCLPAAQAGAQQSIEIIDLQNRPAAEIIPLIEPLLGPDDVVTGTGFRLIIRVAPATLSQLREVLSAFDAVPRNLVVSVRRGGVETTREREAQLQGRIGDVTVGDGSGSRIIHRQTNDRDRGVQTLRVLEGQAAFIHAGESVPVLRHGGIVLPGAVVGPEVDYRDLERGFLVRPWATPTAGCGSTSSRWTSVRAAAAVAASTSSASTPCCRVESANGSGSPVSRTGAI